MGTILLGNPANVVVSKVTQIAILEKKYKVIDWIDDMKSNQLGQLHAIWDVSKSLVESNVLADTTATDIVSNIVPKAVNMHERIVGEHKNYHDQATELRNQITALVNDIKSIVAAASGVVDGVSNDVSSVKRDQAQINSMRSKLLKIVQDNADNIDTSGVTFAVASDDKVSVQFTLALNKMDYNDIDQLANIDLTNKPEEHMHIDNDDHAGKDHAGKDTLNHDVTSEIYEFDEHGNQKPDPTIEPTSVPTDPIPTPEEIEPHAGEAVTDENRKYDLDGDGDIDPDDIMIAYNYYNSTTPPAPAETEAPVVEPTENPSNGSEETQEP